eukprot:TRINITY_DN22644_c0_g1_i1.p1 TRINITY_DN22644_c0_g1~~TRINITY_DN22644_c0_g1_i1.p1  ORF type:complete len:1534 (+),score=395.32 TRINITY_DN22644_c0_g1_i1:23-4624(+)
MAKANRTGSMAVQMACQRKSSKARNGNAQNLVSALKRNLFRAKDSDPETTSSSPKQCDVLEKMSKQLQRERESRGLRASHEHSQPASRVGEATFKRLKRKTQSAAPEAAAEEQPVPKQTHSMQQTPCHKAEEVMASNLSVAAPKKKRKNHGLGAARIAAASDDPSEVAAASDGPVHGETAASTCDAGTGLEQKSAITDDKPKDMLLQKTVFLKRLGRGAQSGKKKQKGTVVGSVGIPDGKQTQQPESCTGKTESVTLDKRAGETGAVKAQLREPKANHSIDKDESKRQASVGSAPKERNASQVPLRRKSKKTRTRSSPQKADQVLTLDTPAVTPHLAACTMQNIDPAPADASTKADRLQATPPRRVPDSSSLKRLKRSTAASGEKRNKQKKLKSIPDEEQTQLHAATKDHEDTSKDCIADLTVESLGSLARSGPEGCTVLAGTEEEGPVDDANKTPPKTSFNWQAAFAKAAVSHISEPSGPADPASIQDKDEEDASKGNEGEPSQERGPADDADEQSASKNRDRQSHQKTAPTEENERDLSKEEHVSSQKAAFTLKAAFAKAAGQPISMFSGPASPALLNGKDNEDGAPQKRGPADAAALIEKSDQCALKENRCESPQKASLADAAASTETCENDVSKHDEGQTPRKTVFRWKAAFAKAAARQGSTSSSPGCSAALTENHQISTPPQGPTPIVAAGEERGASSDKAHQSTQQLASDLRKDEQGVLKDSEGPCLIEEDEQDAAEDKDTQPPQKPAFNWQAAFAKAATAEGPTSTIQELPANLVSVAAPLHTRRDRNKADSGDSKKVAGPPVTWPDRHAPTNWSKQLRPKNVWTELWDWLKAWQPPSQSTAKSKSEQGAAVSGPSGVGKTSGVRLLARRLREHVVEYDMIDAEGRSFMENLAKKQRNGNQLDGKTVVVCNIAEQLTQAHKEMLLQAVQSSVIPVIFVASDGVLNSKDALMEHCLEVKIKLKEPQVAKVLQDVVKKEGSAIGQSTCQQIAAAFPSDLRQAILTAQLLSAAPGGEDAHLPREAMALPAACRRLLSPGQHEDPGNHCVDDTLRLLSLDESVPELLRWNCMRALAFFLRDAFVNEHQASATCSSKEASSSLTEPRSLSDEQQKLEDPSEELQTLEETSEVVQNLGEISEEAQRLGEPSGEMQNLRELSEEAQNLREASEELQHLGETSEEMQKLSEPSGDLQKLTEPSGELQKVEELSGELKKSADPCDEARKEETHQLPPPRPEELEALEACSKIAATVVWSDVAAGMAEAVAIRDGTMVDRVQSPAAGEPLLLAVLSHTTLRCAQDLGISRTSVNEESAVRKFTFHPHTPPCESSSLPQDQLIAVCKQLGLPKSWVQRHVYEFLQCHRSPLSRTPKHFKAWLRRRIQARVLPLQRETSGELATEKEADSACQDTSVSMAIEQDADLARREAFGVVATEKDADPEVSSEKAADSACQEASGETATGKDTDLACQEAPGEVATEKDADSACQAAFGEGATEKVTNAVNVADAIGARDAPPAGDVQLVDGKPCSPGVAPV